MKEILEMNDEEIRDVMRQMEQELKTRNQKREERRLKREKQELQETNRLIIKEDAYYTDKEGKYYHVHTFKLNGMVVFTEVVNKVKEHSIHQWVCANRSLPFKNFRKMVVKEITEREFKEVEKEVYDETLKKVYDTTIFPRFCTFAPSFLTDYWTRDSFILL